MDLKVIYNVDNNNSNNNNINIIIIGTKLLCPCIVQSCVFCNQHQKCAFEHSPPPPPPPLLEGMAEGALAMRSKDVSQNGF